MQPPFDITADLDTPVSAYLKLRPFKPRFLLESVEGGERLARYSFIGFGDCLEVRLDAAGLHVREIGRPAETRPRPRDRATLLAALRGELARAPRPQPEIPGMPLAGGLVGAASYDLVRYFERLPSRLPIEPGVPEACYIAPRSLLIFDHVTRGIALLHAGPGSERDELRREIVRALRGGLAIGRPPARLAAPTPSLTRAEYVDGVGRAQQHIAAGDVYQLVLSARFEGECELEPFEAYRALRLINPSPYMIYCELGDQTLVGSSPEALVRLSGGQAQLRPIAGTRPRGADPAADAALERELLGDVKENAEHVMLVDLARNDLGRVAAAGSVRVDPYRVIERYSHVMHMVSGVQGALAPDSDAFDLFAASFPAGTLVGAPKVRAMEIIEQLEPVRRGFYGGTYGYFGHGGDMDHAITIRTLAFHDGRYRYQAGAGIVADSVPEREHDEVLAKSAVLWRALELAKEGL
ncbi:MAG TPA: anthranilate synthase component I family protein [Steroidobacteraceae bacterium]|nr:anthranilate synthase component I family protein [Steroidobacteraceae bacterium]